MKTAPLYKSLKLDNNKQAKVLAFEGVRAEESTRRSGYDRIGRGVKHSTTVNARPILKWNSAEIFLYLFKQQLPINPAYRIGMTRVGCMVCPFASEWNEFIANREYSECIAPFHERLVKYTTAAGVRDISDFIKQGNWKRRASGNLISRPTHISFSLNEDFTIVIENGKENFLTWLTAIGDYTGGYTGQNYKGELKYVKDIYSFTLNNSSLKVTITFHQCKDASLIGLLKRVAYKAGYCINCESCEVECPTGALKTLPNIKIDKKVCVHCHKCLTFHDNGCIVANSLHQTVNSKMNAQSSIDRYKNFGLKDEWLESFLADPEGFWESDHGLNKTYQVPSLRNWLKDAEIIDDRYQLTELGKLLFQIYQDNPSLVWEVIWINLAYNSFIVSWFTARVASAQNTSSKLLEEQIKIEFPSYKDKTVHNAVYQLFRTLKESPIGEEMCQLVGTSKDIYQRKSYNDLSVEALAYSLYRFGALKGIDFFRVSQLYQPEEEHGIAHEFALSQSELLKKLRALSSDRNHVIIAELNMGLDHITLREDLSPVSVLSVLTQ